MIVIMLRFWFWLGVIWLRKMVLDLGDSLRDVVMFLVEVEEFLLSVIGFLL
jgi:hypothetical protein